MWYLLKGSAKFIYLSFGKVACVTFLLFKEVSKMTNEELVCKIQNSKNAMEYIQTLYENNLPAIKAICKKFSAYCEMDDMLQESFLGLWEAVLHYDSCNEVKFWTYASWWVRQYVKRYIEKCGSCIYLPINIQADILKYKKCIADYEKNNGKIPSKEEIAKIMKVSVDKIMDFEILSQPITSINAPLSDDYEDCIVDTIEDVQNVENEVVNGMHEKHIEKELWKILDENTEEIERLIIREFFANGKTVLKIAEEYGMTASQVRTIKEKGLTKMRRIRVKRELEEKLEYFDSRIYHTGVRPFKISFTSATEDFAIRRYNMTTKYEKMIAE